VDNVLGNKIQNRDIRHLKDMLYPDFKLCVVWSTEALKICREGNEFEENANRGICFTLRLLWITYIRFLQYYKTTVSKRFIDKNLFIKIFQDIYLSRFIYQFIKI